MILHEAASVSRWPVVAVQIATEHPEHCHLLPAVMGCVRQPSRHGPGSRPHDIEELRLLLPPSLIRLTEPFEPTSAVLRVALDELRADFTLGKRWRSDVDAEHVPKPGVLADTLMHHLLVYAPAPRIVVLRTHREVLVAELTP